jgi:hypothetical protein
MKTRQPIRDLADHRRLPGRFHARVTARPDG